MPPELQKILQKQAEQHWKSWLDEPIPVLDGMTPKQAAKDKKGKEKLEALLLLYERNSTTSPLENFYKPDLAYLRKQLKI